MKIQNTKFKTYNSNNQGFKANVLAKIKLPCGEKAVCPPGETKIVRKAIMVAIKQGFLKAEDLIGLRTKRSEKEYLEVCLIDKTTPTGQKLLANEEMMELKSEEENSAYMDKIAEEIKKDAATIQTPIEASKEEICPRLNILSFLTQDSRPSLN